MEKARWSRWQVFTLYGLAALFLGILMGVGVFWLVTNVFAPVDPPPSLLGPLGPETTT
jgi:polyferredoxin